MRRRGIVRATASAVTAALVMTVAPALAVEPSSGLQAPAGEQHELPEPIEVAAPVETVGEPSPDDDGHAAPDGPGPIDVAEATARPGEEIVRLRSESSKTFATDDEDRLETRVYALPVHFRRQGRWEEIDARLVDGGGGRLRSAATSFGLSLARDHQDRELAHLQVGDGVSVGFGLEGARPGAGTVAKDDPATVVYRGVRPEVDLRLTSTGTGVKEELVLRSPEAQSRFVFPLTLRGLTVEMEADTGRVVYRDAAGEIRVAVPQGWMSEATSATAGAEEFSDGVAYEIVAHGSGSALQVTLDRAWLDDPDRIYPVVVDPTHTTRPYLYDDTYVREGSTSNFASSTQLNAGANATYKWRTFMQFGKGDRGGLIPLEGHHPINWARVHLYNYLSAACVPTNSTTMSSKAVQIKRVTQSWSGTAQTWPGPSYDAKAWAYTNQSLGYGDCPAGWLSFTVTDLARDWYANTFPNYGIAVVASTSWADTHRRFYSQEYATTSLRPYMEVNWTNTTPDVPVLRSPADGAKLSSPPTRLDATFRDADGDWGWNVFTLQLWDGSAWVAVSDITNKRGGVTGCCSASLTLPTLSDGQYRWRVRSDDNFLLSGWAPSSTTWYSFTVDATPPVAPTISSSTHPSQTTWYPSGDVSLAWSASDTSGINGYSWILDQTSTTTPNTTSNGTATSTSYAGLTDGTWWFHVRARNGAGLWGDTRHFRIQVDTTAPAAPTVSSSTHPSQSTWYPSGDVSLAWSASDTSGINGYSWIVDQVATTTPNTTSNGTATSTSVAGLADGMHYLHVRARNGAGLWGTTRHFKIQVDTTAPAAPAVSSSTHPSQSTWYRSGDVSLAWSASDTSGINGYSWIVDQIATTTPNTTSNGTATSTSIAGLTDGVHYLHVRARNGAGLWGTTRHFKIQIDTMAPGGVEISSTTHPDPDVWASSQFSATWTAATDSLSGIAGYAVLVDQTATTNPTGTLRTTTSYTHPTALKDGLYYLHVRSKDNAGNWGPTAHYRFGVDTGTAAITQPADGQTLQGVVTLEASSSPSAKSAEFQVYSGGDPTLSTAWTAIGTDSQHDASYKWHVDWNTDDRGSDGARRFPNGPYRIRVVFTYDAGVTRAVNGPLVTVDDTRLGIASHWSFYDLGLGGQVNLATGNVVISGEDASLPTGTGNLSIARAYNSRGASRLGTLGWGWELGLPTDAAPAEYQTLEILERDADGHPAVVGITDVTGEVVYFLYDQTLDSGPAWIVESSEQGLSLAKDGDGLWTLTDIDTTAYRFQIQPDWPVTAGSTRDAQYDEVPLTEVAPPSGSGTTKYVYLPDGRLHTVTDTLSGKAFALTWNADGTVDKVLAAFDSNRVAVDYHYDSSSRLTSVTDRTGLTVQYRYGTGSEKNLIAGITPPGMAELQLGYDAAVTGKLIETVRMAGTSPATTAFSYAGRSDGEPGTVTTVTPPRGAAAVTATHNWTYTFDDASRPTAITPPAGPTQRTSWDAYNRVLTSQTAAEAAVGPDTYTEHRYSDTVPCVAGDIADGTELCELIGPSQTHTKADGTTAEQRPVTRYFYDEEAYGSDRLLPEGTARNRPKLTTREVAPDGTITLYAYHDGAGGGLASRRPNQIIMLDATNRVISRRTYNYDPSGRVISETMPKAIEEPDSAPYTTSFTYDSDGLLQTRSKPGTATHTIQYDRWGQLKSYTDGSGTAARDYDPTTGRLLRATDPSGKITTYTYHAETGLPAATSDASGTIARSYDDWGRVTSQTDAGGETTTFAYDSESNLTTRTDRHATTSFEHDAMGRTTKLVDAVGTVTYSYANDGTLHTTKLPNGITATSTSRPAIGDIDTLTYTDANGSKLGAFDRDYDIAGRLTVEARPGGSRQYTYDALGRLVQASDRDGSDAIIQTRSYTYDANTNRTAKTVTDHTGAVTSTETYNHDTADRLTTRTVNSTTSTYSYDPAGNLTSGDGRAYSWSATDRIEKIDTTEGGTSISVGYTLDPLGRTLRRTETRDGTTTAASTHHYADDSDAPAWTRDTDSTGVTQVTRHVVGPAGLAATQIIGGDITIPLATPHGEIWATTDPAGSVLTTADHDEFGTLLTGGIGRYGWLGRQQRETDTALDVVLMGVRLYQPASGRFLSADPIYGGSANDYDYCNADPLNCYDLMGQSAWKKYSVTYGPAVEIWGRRWSKLTKGATNLIPFRTSIESRTMRVTYRRTTNGGRYVEYKAEYWLQQRVGHCGWFVGCSWTPWRTEALLSTRITRHLLRQA